MGWWHSYSQLSNFPPGHLAVLQLWAQVPVLPQLHWTYAPQRMDRGVYKKGNVMAPCSLQSPVKPRDNIKDITTPMVNPAHLLAVFSPSLLHSSNPERMQTFFLFDTHRHANIVSITPFVCLCCSPDKEFEILEIKDHARIT